MTSLINKTLFLATALAILMLPKVVYASISAGSTSNLDQTDFRWRQDDNTESAATWRAAANTGITGIATSESDLRLRFHITVPTNRVSVAVLPRLEFSSDATTCTDGTWNTIGAQASGSVFRLKASSQFADGDASTQQISADTFVTGDIYESSQTGASISLTGNTEGTEVEWSIEANGAAASTTYRFRVSDNGTAMGSYTNCATLGTASPTSFTQNQYRFYEDNDATNPTAIWGNPDLSENSPLTIVPPSNDPPDTTQEVRLRINFTVNNSALSASSKQFKLQFRAGVDSDCSTGSWTDVGTSQAWDYATSTVTDGATITSVLSGSDVAGQYAKSSPTTTNANSASVGQDIEYDFHIIGSGTTEAQRYLLRAVESDATVFDGYTNCPIIYTQPGMSNMMRHGNIFTSTGDEVGFFWAD